MNQQFNLTGSLPEGTLLLEASAGTGKTSTIASLATRYVVEGIARIDQLLIITFGRSATHELRERIRTELNRAAALYDEPARGRAVAALATFDTATIATTHQFCAQALQSLGITADVDPLETLVEDLTDLVTEVVDDLFVRAYGVVRSGKQPVQPDFSRQEAQTIASKVVENPFAEIFTPGDASEARIRFARTVRNEVLSRRRQRGLITFDDLVMRLAAAVNDPDTGETDCARLRRRFPIVMVDEFQDTDESQWQLLRRIFHKHSTLIMIGDPKQAIYAFRGGDITTYLEASKSAESVQTLSQNWRSDEPLVTAVRELFGDVALGDERIRVTDVAAHTPARLHGAGNPLRLRVINPAGSTQPVAQLRPKIAADVADQVAQLLSGPATLTLKEEETRQLRPGDIAVIVEKHNTSEPISAALRELNIPSIVRSGASVFGTAAAHHWLRLLRALESPHSNTVVRAAMITPFFGITGEELALPDDPVGDATALLLRRLASDLTAGGVARLLESITTATDLTHRVLQAPDGERLLTDIGHIGELLHRRSRSGAGTAGLTNWLATRVREAAANKQDETSRRLDSDANAVQILTVHASKGLEFPIVLLPEPWDRFVGDNPDVLRCHDSTGKRVIDVRRSGPQRDQLLAAHDQEDEGESFRKLYVAITRANCQVIMWWAASANTSASSLHRLLAARIAGHTEPAATYAWDTLGDQSLARINLAAEVINPEIIQSAWGGETTDLTQEALAQAPFDRQVDTAWRRTSYSGLTSAVHEAHYRALDGGHGQRDDESDPQDPNPSDLTPAPAGLIESPMANLPAGTTFGTVVHHSIELFDSDNTDLLAELRRCADIALTTRPIDGLDPMVLATALRPAFEADLGPLAGGINLSAIDDNDRLAELDFEFPMAGGEEPNRDVFIQEIADLLRVHLPDNDPLIGYADLLESSGLSKQQLRGFLSGSIDSIFRFHHDSSPRFVVVDYKTNWLGGGIKEQQLATWDYRPKAMAAAMMASHYPLQALLYSVALHRYLRWRLPDYDPEQHLGGVLYLYLRGMSKQPSNVAAPEGVFQWRPPAQLIVDLSETIAGVS